MKERSRKVVVEEKSRLEEAFFFLQALGFLVYVG